MVKWVAAATMMNPIRSGSGCIADCVVASQCMVIELKPDTKQAMNDGDKQRAAYAEGLVKWYEKDQESLLKEYDDLKRCVNSSGALVIDSKLETYRFCPDSSEAADWGPKLELRPAVSESD